MDTAYRDYVSIVQGYGWEDEVRLEYLIEIQTVILEKLAAAGLHGPKSGEIAVLGRKCLAFGRLGVGDLMFRAILYNFSDSNEESTLKMSMTDAVKIAIEMACKNVLPDVRIEKKRKLYQTLKV